MKLSFNYPEHPRAIRVIVAAGIGAAALTGCSQNEESPRTYVCSDEVRYTPQKGQGLEDLLRYSGALDEAITNGDGIDLAQTLNYVATRDGLDAIIDKPIDLTGSVPSNSFPLRDGEDYLIPTSCTVTESN